MATINSREVVDQIIAGNGVYPGDESYPVVKIVQYNNAFDGKICYGLTYRGDPIDQYKVSQFIRNPKTIWVHESVAQLELALTMWYAENKYDMEHWDDPSLEPDEDWQYEEEDDQDS